MAGNPIETAPIVEPVRGAKEIRRAYDLWSYIYSGVAAPLEHGPRKRALELANIQPHEKVLEVATGPGQILLEILKRLDRTNIAYGVDLSWKMIEKCGRLVHGAGYHNLSLTEADTRQLPFADQTFDVVYSSYTLDILSVQDILAALKEFRRVLKGSGRVMLVNLSKQSPQSRTWVEYLYEWLPATWVPYLLGGCRPVFLADLAREAGFSSVQRKFVGGLMSSEIVSASASST
jgi:demethylmenaquinone methyltransferase/2-methoxy-6-polyprenyl-1,4-benzoquinol methylase